jgi:hypothetical protein
MARSAPNRSASAKPLAVVVWERCSAAAESVGDHAAQAPRRALAQAQENQRCSESEGATVDLIESQKGAQC